MIAPTATSHELILDLTGQKWECRCQCGQWSQAGRIGVIGEAHLAHVEAAIA